MTAEVVKFIKANVDLGGSPLTVAEVTALNYGVTNLKTNGLYPTSGVLYPLVGTSAITQSLNLLDPSTYRITWGNDSAGNHTASGWTAASTNFGDTGFGGNQVVFGDSCLFFYSRTNNTINGSDTGLIQSSARLYDMAIRFSNGLTYARCYADVSSTSQAIFGLSGVTDSRGFFCLNRSGNVITLSRNGTVLSTASSGTAATLDSSSSLIIGRRGGETTTTGRQYALFGNVRAMTSTQQSTFSTIIQNMQTILSRQV